MVSPSGIEETSNIIRSLNEPSVDLYAWISSTTDGMGGWAYRPGACDNSHFLKTSITTLYGHFGSTEANVLATVSTLAHEIGHNLGMEHDFDSYADALICRKSSNGDLMSCSQCDNWFNASYTSYTNPQSKRYRKLSPETGSAGDCCTGIMAYDNAPRVWSTCSRRYFEEHYVAESWFLCMKDVVPSLGILYTIISMVKY